MAGRIKVLDAANRTMQRLGYLKALAVLVNETQSSNLETLGRRFISRVTQRVRLSPPYAEDLQKYARTRLTDGAYKELRKTIMENAGPAVVELQDVYLADRSLPSSTGKLVEVPCHRDLRALLDDQDRATIHMLARPDGQPLPSLASRSG